MSIDTLGYGLRDAVPETATAAWGARLIITMDGYVDFVHDRTDAVGEDGPRRALLDKLTATVPGAMLARIIKEKILAGEIDSRVERDVVLFDDDGLKIVANTNASCGYLYVAAFETGDET
jgi:hypothetical protein